MVIFLIICIVIALFVGVAIGTAMGKQSAIDTVETRLRAKERIEQEKADIFAGEQWASKTPLCPKCHSKDGVIGSHYECMDICLDYCHDPFYWHAAQCKFGTYSGVSRKDAVLKIGKRLREKGK